MENIDVKDLLGGGNSNIFHLHLYLGNMNPFWLAHIFQMGWWTQPPTTWNAKCPIFLGNLTPKTSNYCLKNRALGFPGSL